MQELDSEIRKKMNANFVSKLTSLGAFVRLNYYKWQIAQFVSFGDGNIEYDFFGDYPKPCVNLQSSVE